MSEPGAPNFTPPPPSDLETKASRTLAQKLAAVRRQRDTLLEELERLARSAHNDDPKMHHYDEINPADVKRAFRIAKRVRASIAKGHS